MFGSPAVNPAIGGPIIIPGDVGILGQGLANAGITDPGQAVAELSAIVGSTGGNLGMTNNLLNLVPGVTTGFDQFGNVTDPVMAALAQTGQLGQFSGIQGTLSGINSSLMPILGPNAGAVGALPQSTVDQLAFAEITGQSPFALQGVAPQQGVFTGGQQVGLPGGAPGGNAAIGGGMTISVNDVLGGAQNTQAIQSLQAAGFTVVNTPGVATQQQQDQIIQLANAGIISPAEARVALGLGPAGGAPIGAVGGGVTGFGAAGGPQDPLSLLAMILANAGAGTTGVGVPPTAQAGPTTFNRGNLTGVTQPAAAQQAVAQQQPRDLFGMIIGAIMSLFG